MIRGFIFFLTFTIQICSYSQELIVDGSFENRWSPPNYIGQINHLYYWNNVNRGSNNWPFATPDYFSLDGTNQAQLPNTWNGFITPKDGIAIVGLVFTDDADSSFREYISSELRVPLKKGKHYRLRFNISNANKDSLFSTESDLGCNCVQIAFTDKTLYQKDHEAILLDTPTLSIDTVLFKKDWFQVDYTFKAASNANYITIGNFKQIGTFITKYDNYNGAFDDGRSAAYYFFDSLSLKETYSLETVSSTQIQVCEKQEVTLKATGDYVYKWIDLAEPTIILSQDSSLTIYTTSDKKYQVIGTKDSILYSISTLPYPTISTQNASFCVGDSATILAEGIFDDFEWNDGSKEQIRVIKNTGILTLIAKNKLCEISKTILITDKVCDIEIEFPNVFTPNQDGVNDTFKPIKYLGIKNASVKLINRWGNEIDHFDNMTSGWKAENAVDGIYFWECTYTDLLERQNTIKGIVQVLR